MTVIKSPYMESLPSLARLARSLADPPPPAPQAAASAPVDPIWSRAIERAEPAGPGRDRVADAPEREPAFAYRTSDDLIRHLPPAARDLLRRLDDFATDSRDRTVAMTGHIRAAEDRAGRVSIDVQAAIRAAKLPEVATLDDARAMVQRDRWPEHYTEPMIAHARRIVTEGERLREAHAEVQRLRERQRAHAAQAAPITALRERVVRALGRSRPPFLLVELPDVPRGKAEKTLAEARETIAALTAEIARIETARPNEHEAFMLAMQAVERYAAEASLRPFARWTGTGFAIEEPIPGATTEDRRPARPLAALAAVVPKELAAAIVRVIGVDPDAPLMRDRPRLIAEARARLRQAELSERAALHALGDPLDRLAERPDADPLLAILVEASR